MQTKLIWDKAKRTENLSKHGLDFAQAHCVLDSRLRMDVDSMRNGELRVQSFSYVLDVLAVLTVVHTEREQAMRVISFRHASFTECEVYYEWLDNQ